MDVIRDEASLRPFPIHKLIFDFGLDMLKMMCCLLFKKCECSTPTLALRGYRLARGASSCANQRTRASHHPLHRLRATCNTNNI